MGERLYILSLYPSGQFLESFCGYLQKYFPHIPMQRVRGGVENLGVVLIQEGETIVINNNRAPLGWGHYGRQHKMMGRYVYLLYPNRQLIRPTSYRGLDGVLYRNDDGWLGFRISDDNEAGHELPAQLVLQKSLGPSKTGPIDITEFLDRENAGI